MQTLKINYKNNTSELCYIGHCIYYFMIVYLKVKKFSIEYRRVSVLAGAALLIITIFLVNYVLSVIYQLY